jgi:predicted transposase/invertase (TIGR01784 family)
VIKNGWRLKNQPKELQEEIFTRLFKACDIPRFSKKKRIQYEKDMYDERRLYGEMEAAKMIGREEGREEGKIARAQEIAHRLLSDGVPAVKVAEYTGLSLETIERSEFNEKP